MKILMLNINNRAQIMLFNGYSSKNKSSISSVKLLDS